MGEMAENDKIINLLKTLVEIESPSKKEDQIKEFVKNYLKNLGYEVFESENYIATKTTSDLIVATHLDTLPLNYKFSYDGVYAYGTGVCDAKASITAMLVAAENKLNYTLAFFSDEEEDGLGSKEFVKTWEKGKFAIVMEPTNLEIASKHWGSFELIIKVEGKEAHGAFPEKGINAIEKTFELYKELKKLNLKLNPLRINGGSEKYIIPDICEVKFEIFLKPEEKISDYLEKIKFIENFGKYEIDHVYEGYISGEVVKYLEEAIKLAKLPVSYTEMKSWTDALNLKERFDVVVWGPGNLEFCHTKEEKVKIEEIKKAIEVLISLNFLFSSKNKPR
jgi:acetylornithine deacetylase